ncbi:MAG: hypothetical protein ACE5GS_17590 [Kiloniellaceae bacterium]
MAAALALAPALSGCTAGQAYQAVAEAGADAEAYYAEQVQVRRDWRALKRRAVEAEYEALMRLADEAERGGEMDQASDYWAAARALIDREMPSLRRLKAKVIRFFEDPTREAEGSEGQP